MNTRKTCQSGERNQGRDWKDQLHDIGEVLKVSESGDCDEVCRDAVRPGVSPPGEFHSAGKNGKSYVSNGSNCSYLSGILIGGEAETGDKQSHVTSVYETIEVEKSMSKNSEDPFSSFENNSSNYENKGRTGRNARHDEEDSEELSEEDLLRLAKEARIKKGFLWTILSVSTVTLVCASIAVAQGLLGNHKSNIMNL